MYHYRVMFFERCLHPFVIVCVIQTPQTAHYFLFNILFPYKVEESHCRNASTSAATTVAVNATSGGDNAAATLAVISAVTAGANTPVTATDIADVTAGDIAATTTAATSAVTDVAIHGSMEVFIWLMSKLRICYLNIASNNRIEFERLFYYVYNELNVSE